jgi:hypothetical protein
MSITQTPNQTPAPAPDAPAEEQTLWEKIGTALPIGLTALATVFAGLSSGELQKAMFWRTTAGQDQARATNQWTYAGLKKNRSLIMESIAVAQLVAAAGRNATFEPDTKNPVEVAAVQWLSGKGPPRVKMPDTENKDIDELLKAIADRIAESEIQKIAARITPEQINKAIDTTADFNARTQDDWDKVKDAVKALVRKKKGDAAAEAARYSSEQRRYGGESFMELRLGFLYDARVRVVTAVSDHHRKRSENFFYAMLAAQIGAVVSTLALSRKTSTALWLLAALFGLSALAYGGFVHVAI